MGTVFRQSGHNFRDCFQTVRTKFLGLFSSSPKPIFGLCVCCFFSFYVLLQKFDKHVSCVKIVLIHAYGCIDMEFMMDVNYMKKYI